MVRSASEPDFDPPVASDFTSEEETSAEEDSGPGSEVSVLHLRFVGILTLP